MKSERNYGIDLLRLILMYMVCVLHTLGHGGILGACVKETIPYKVFWLLEICSYCAVDGFALISGYMISNKPCKYEKIVEMWIQALFYSLVLTLLLKVIGVNFEWGRTDILKSVLLITYDRFWYFTAYFCSFFVAPFINQFVLEISEKKAKIYFIVFLSLFGIIGFIADTFKTEEGYSAFWLIILYYIGAFAKQGKVFEKKENICSDFAWGD